MPNTSDGKCVSTFPTLRKLIMSEALSANLFYLPEFRLGDLPLPFKHDIPDIQFDPRIIREYKEALR